MIEKLRQSAALVRDIGLIVGIPTVVYIATQLYGLQQQSTQAQIATLKEQVELLRERQYDRAAVLLKAQKEVSEAELDMIDRSIKVLGNQKASVRDLNGKLLCLDVKSHR